MVGLISLLHRHPRHYSQQLRRCTWESTGLGEQEPGQWQYGEGASGRFIVVLIACLSVCTTADLLPGSLQQ